MLRMRSATLNVPLASTSLDTSRLPLSRAAAVQSWSRALWTTALTQITVLAIHGAFQERPVIPGDARIDPTIHALMGALFLPLALVSLVRRAEKRLLRRPPKALLAWQAGLYVLGSLVATFETLRMTGFEDSTPLYWAGHGILALSVLLVAVWFTGAFLASSGEIPA
jgi:hypothetical protein